LEPLHFIPAPLGFGGAGLNAERKLAAGESSNDHAHERDSAFGGADGETVGCVDEIVTERNAGGEGGRDREKPVTQRSDGKDAEQQHHGGDGVFAGKQPVDNSRDGGYGDGARGYAKNSRSRPPRHV